MSLILSRSPTSQNTDINPMPHRLCEKFNNLLPVTISDSLSHSMTNVRVIIFVSDKLDDTKELTFDHLAYFFNLGGDF